MRIENSHLERTLGLLPSLLFSQQVSASETLLSVGERQPSRRATRLGGVDGKAKKALWSKSDSFQLGR
jgi:hypothetical protein